MKLFTSRLAALLLAFALAPWALAQEVVTKAEPAAARTEESAAYVRVRDSEDGTHTYLQVAIRSFKNPDKADLPVVRLVGVTHIGDKAYYDELQKLLDEQDVVLFEGVKPGSAASDLAKADDAAKAKVTKSRQRLLAILVTRYREKHGELPKTLAEAYTGLHGSMGRLGKAASLDGWGRPNLYEIQPAHEGRSAKFDIVSLGADGLTGGQGADADVKFSAQKPLTKDEKSGGEGIQLQLAKALGLEFQLVAVDYNRTKWRNSDMTIDELQKALEEAGASGGMLFSMLDGSSMMSKLLGAFLGMVASSPEMSFMMKAMVVETLAHADEMMESQAAVRGMGAMMKVLIEERNKVVFKDLERLITEEPEVKSVALFFGAGHLPDMEERLAAMGYRETGVTWKNAIDVDSGAIRGGKALIKQVRSQVEQAVRAQRKSGTAKPDDADNGAAMKSRPAEPQ
jgi:hypothetical protein